MRVLRALAAASVLSTVGLAAAQIPQRRLRRQSRKRQHGRHPAGGGAAFRRRPKARAGWKNMTETQRKHELFAVFYYRTPESREKRVQGLCDVAEKRV